jgi:hypothetical protein
MVVDYRVCRLVMLVGCLGLSAQLSLLSCAHRKNGADDAAAKAVLTKPQPGNRYVRKALHLHQLYTDPFVRGAEYDGPYFCAYVAESETDFQGTAADFLKTQIRSKRFQPLNIGRLARHYGFNAKMFEQGVRDAKFQSAFEKYWQAPGAFLTSVAFARSKVKSLFAKDSFEKTQAQDEADLAAAKLNRAGERCRAPEQIAKIKSKVELEISRNTAARISNSVEVEFEDFGALEFAISKIAETQGVKKNALCPQGTPDEVAQQLLVPFNLLSPEGCGP